MNCPFCSHVDTKVNDSRPDAGGRSIRRRRECLSCGRKWRTLERIEDEMPLVIKRNQTYQPYDRAKLLNSIVIACGKRPVTMSQLENAVAEIEWFLLEKGTETISTTLLGEKVMEHLRKLDEIAYVRYASVYRRFSDVGELIAEMKDLVPAAAPGAESEKSVESPTPSA